MTTVADIEGRELTPLSALLAAADVPGDLVELDGDLAALLDRALFTDATLQPVENGYLGGIVLVLTEEIALRPFGDAVVLALGDELTVVEAELGLEARPGGFGVTLALLDVAVGLRVDGSVLRPVLPGSSEPGPAADGLDLALGSVTLRLATGRPVALDVDAAPVVPRCMVGETGVIVAAASVRWLTPGSEDLPAGTPADFTGLHLDDVLVELAALDQPALAIDDAFLGRGGVTATAALAGLELTGTLAGFGFTLRSLGVTLVQNAVTGCAIGGTLQVPFFDRPVDVAVSLSGDGGLWVALGAAVDLDVPGLGTFHLAALRLSVDDGAAVLVLSGVLAPTVAGLEWPEIGIEALGIDTEGRVTIGGGWLDLQHPLALDLYGFGLEITRAGFGTEADGRRWFGVDGAIRLTELLPAGASARGLRVLWDPDDPGAPPALVLEGIGVFFGVPDAFGFEGEVALTEDPATGAKLFTGALALGLEALDIGVDAGIAIGHDASVTYVFVHLGVDVPIPVAATGTALYGLEGLFAMNMSPRVTRADVPAGDGGVVERGDWYGWYRDVPDVFSVTDPFKWSPDPGAWAFGAGLSLGTLPDAGFSVNTKALLVLLLPGPVILLQGTADILKPPAAFGGGATQEGTLGMLAALDGRAGTLQLGIDAAWRVPVLLDIAASAEAFFDFDRGDAWHLWVGRDEPESLRIRAEVLSLFHADSWLMLDADGIGTGLGVSWGDSWRFGVVRLTLSAWIAASASLSTRPAQLAGGLELGGEAAIAAGPFELGLAVEAGLEAESFAPYRVAGTLSVVVGLPMPLKDLDVDIGLEWSRPETPEIEDPWTAALLEHERCTESWTPVVSSPGASPDADAPVIPLDARVLLTFAQPMGDETGVADNPPAAPPHEGIGHYDAAYALTGLSLWRRRRSHPGEDWVEVTGDVFGTWTPDAGGAGSRLQLLARSPFAFTRSTSRRWTDSFLEAEPTWPCVMPPPARRTCIDWSELKIGAVLPRLSEQEGAVLSSEGDLEVRDVGGRRAVGLRWGTAPDGTPQPGILFIALPEPAAEVTMAVDVPGFDWVALRAWSGTEQVAVDLGVPGTETLRVAAESIDAVTLGWGFNVEPALFQVCWTTRADADAQDAWSAAQNSLETAAERWSSDEPILEPDSRYLLEITTRALLTEGGDEVQRTEEQHAVQFQTGGPPGIVPLWVPAPAPPAPNTSVGFPHGGVLASLAPYVRRSIPDLGARPVFRAYDLGCEFDASCVQQMYGADLRIRVRDSDGRTAVDASGAEIVFANAWEEAPATTLTTSESAWLTRLDACTGAVEWVALATDDAVRSAVPGLVYDDFSGTLLTTFMAHVLDPEETRAAGWHLDGGVLLQDVRIAGGDAAASSPDKPGTAYVADGVDAAGVAVETLAWAENGSFGLVFRWQGEADHYRFSVGAQRLRLVRVRAGIAQELWSEPGSYEPGVPIRLVLQADGARIRCQVDERLMCDIAEPGVEVPPGGSVGLYTWNSDTTAFDELRARNWPGPALAPDREFSAELEASRLLFTDAFEDLDTFEQVVLSSGAAATAGSATGGTATLERPRSEDGAVAVLAGDAVAADYVIECSVRPDATGAFGLVARHGESGHLTLQLDPSGGRSLVETRSAAGKFGAVRVLWRDDVAVDVGATYALALRCEGTTVIATIDGEEFTATTSLASGRFGLHSAIPGRGCAFSDLVVRSAPRTAVHNWSFTTSRYLGLPDLLDAFAGRTWAADGDGVNRADLATQADAGSKRLAAAKAEVDVARSALAAAVTARDAVETAGLAAAARAAVDTEQAASADVYDLLTGALGMSWRPEPPVVEVLTVIDGAATVALLLDLPEPLPWERVDWSFTRDNDVPLDDVVLAHSRDGAHAIFVRAGAAALQPGAWNLRLVLRLDVGAERAAWRRGGSTAAEVGELRFAI